MSSSTTRASNLLVDGDFELGTTTANPVTVSTVGQGWALFNGKTSYSTAYAESGTSSLLEVNGAGDNWDPAGAYQIVSGTAGASYTLSGYYLTDTGASSPIGPVDFQIQFLDSGLNNLATFETGWTGSGAALKTWNLATVTATAPTGTAYVSVYAMFMDNGQAATENFYFDNLSLTGPATAVPEPGTLALMGLGLASGLALRRRQ